MIQPTDKYIMEDYRTTLGTNDAPQMIDTEASIQPVAVVNQGLPKPNAKQILRYTTVYMTTTATQYQIATVSSATNIYFIGYYYENRNAVANNCIIFDGTTGTGPSLSANTAYSDENGYLGIDQIATTHQNNVILPLPQKVKTGIRFYGGAAGVSSHIIIYWLEEKVY